MSIEFKSELNGTSLKVTAFQNGVEAGRAKSLTDGHAWAILYGIETNDLTIEKALIEQVTNILKGQEIFTISPLEKVSLFESLGYIRSKNGFTYFGENLSEKEENELTISGFYLPLGYKYETEFGSIVGDFPVGKKSKKIDVSINYTNENKNIDFLRINEILQSAFQDERKVETTKDTFLNSQYVQYVYDGEYLIGCARAIADEKMALILNVAIDPAYQGLHLGWNVVVKLAEQMPNKTIFLNTHPGGVGFYNRKGFRRNKTAFMFPAHEMPPEISIGFHLPAGYRFPDEY